MMSHATPSKPVAKRKRAGPWDPATPQQPWRAFAFEWPHDGPSTELRDARKRTLAWMAAPAGAAPMTGGGGGGRWASASPKAAGASSASSSSSSSAAAAPGHLSTAPPSPSRAASSSSSSSAAASSSTSSSAAGRAAGAAPRTNAEAMYAELNSGAGYVVIPRALFFDHPLALADPSRLDYVQIFQGYKHRNVGGFGADEELLTTTTTGDGKRSQADLNHVRDGAYRDVHDVLRTVTETLFPGRSMRNLVALQSAPGCRPQPKHTDFDFKSKAAREAAQRMTAQTNMPLLAFVALQNETPLRVWPGSWRALHAAWRGAPLPPLPSGGRMHRAVVHEGDMLLFRPDLVHAGDGFDETNFRLHAYLMSQTPALAFRENTTHLIDDASSGLDAVARALKQ